MYSHQNVESDPVPAHTSPHKLELLDEQLPLFILIQMKVLRWSVGGIWLLLCNNGGIFLELCVLTSVQ